MCSRYSKLRVNGKLSKILKNLELFNKIKETQYSNIKMITRVSGVKISKDQSFKEMNKLWGDLVDQVAFVDYNPWENSYDKDTNNISEPCSDLWRRMFIWWDGKVNPCDTDYKSTLKINQYNGDISETWLSENYQLIRNQHLNKKRQNLKPCRSCNVI